MPRSPSDALLREILPIPDIGPYSITLYPGRLDETCLINLMNQSHVVIANLVVPKRSGEGSIDGVVINQGSITGGWALYVKNSKPTYVYNCVGIESYKVTAANPLSAGEHQVRVEFACSGVGNGGTATLFVDGAKAGSMRVSRARMRHVWLNDPAPMPGETASRATPDYAVSNGAFGGEIKWIRIEVSRPPSAGRLA
jgi:hypothetical protein